MRKEYLCTLRHNPAFGEESKIPIHGINLSFHIWNIYKLIFHKKNPPVRRERVKVIFVLYLIIPLSARTTKYQYIELTFDFIRLVYKIFSVIQYLNLVFLGNKSHRCPLLYIHASLFQFLVGRKL